MAKKRQCNRYEPDDGFAQKCKVPVVIFSIAFGQDADTSIMQQLAADTNVIPPGRVV